MMGNNGAMATANDTLTAEVWLDVVAAVDYLSEHHRLGLTIWEAVEEAVRWWTAGYVTPAGDVADPTISELPWVNDPDPMRTTLQRLLEVLPPPTGRGAGPELADVFTSALRSWVDTMADQYNDGHRWMHPAPRRGWPQPRLPSRDDQ